MEKVFVMNSPHYGCCGKPVSEGTCTCGGNKVISPPRVLNSQHNKPEPLGLPGPWEFRKDNSQQQVANEQPTSNYSGKGLTPNKMGNKPEPLGIPVWKF